MTHRWIHVFGAAALCSAALALAFQEPRTVTEKTWLVGSNYIPANAINELEMWQAATFAPKRIDRELGWAQGLGMNTMRVFLHDVLWSQDSKGFTRRLNTFLTICQRHKIKPLLVLFDSCWDPFP